MDALFCYLDQTFQILHFFHIIQQLGCQQICGFLNVYAYFSVEQVKQRVPPENNTEQLDQPDIYCITVQIVGCFMG